MAEDLGVKEECHEDGNVRQLIGEDIEKGTKGEPPALPSEVIHISLISGMARADSPELDIAQMFDSSSEVHFERIELSGSMLSLQP